MCGVFGCMFVYVLLCRGQGTALGVSFGYNIHAIGLELTN